MSPFIDPLETNQKSPAVRKEPNPGGSGIHQLPKIRNEMSASTKWYEVSERKQYEFSWCKILSCVYHTIKTSKDLQYNLLLEYKRQGDNATFIRTVKLAPEPSCVLATNRQLHDLARFYCDPYQYSPVTVDPTINLGPYNTTIVTYQTPHCKESTLTSFNGFRKCLPHEVIALVTFEIVSSFNIIFHIC